MLLLQNVETRETSSVSADNTCGKCAPPLFLTDRVGELELQLGNRRIIRATESFIDKSFGEVVTPEVWKKRS